jgi:endoglucanase
MAGPAQTAIPRWRGFNLLEMFTTRSDGNFREDDFRWIAEWGFDFVRLPMCYLLWVEEGDPFRISEPALANVDRAIELGRQYGVHVCLNFHRAPGYSVNREREEPFNLWKDQAALKAFCFHWELLAERYRGTSSERVSFNLVNEPPNATEGGMTRADHERVMRAGVAAIRAIDPQRLIIIDGLSWGREPCPELLDLGIAQSCRAYDPMGISHYRASWVGGENLPEPTWPGARDHRDSWDRAKLAEHYEPWAELARQGAGVHCGEGGAFNKTPHDVFLRWLRDVLEILTSHSIGYALWNFRGSFGVLDSGRQDVDYEDWHGHSLDRELLELLTEF